LLELPCRWGWRWAAKLGGCSRGRPLGRSSAILLVIRPALPGERSLCVETCPIPPLPASITSHTSLRTTAEPAALPPARSLAGLSGLVNSAPLLVRGGPSGLPQHGARLPALLSFWEPWLRLGVLSPFTGHCSGPPRDFRADWTQLRRIAPMVRFLRVLRPTTCCFWCGALQAD